MKKYYSDVNVHAKNQKPAENGAALSKTSSSRGTPRDSRGENVNNQMQEEITLEKLKEDVTNKPGVYFGKTVSSRARHRLRPVSGASAPIPPQNDAYFRSYDRLTIHQEMLKDQVRTLTFKDAICCNKHLFKDKVVLDIGCGTGILSLFAAKAGAKLVIGIECSDIIDLAGKIVQSQEPDIRDRIILVKGRVEDIVELPEGVMVVDVIISEWMGYCLLFESMLDTVLYAREKWLVPGGLMFPDKVTLYMAGMEDRQRRDLRLTWWLDVYGFNLSAVQKWFNKLAIVEYVNPYKIVTNDYVLKEFDLYTVKKEDLSFTVPIELTALQDAEMQALVTFFTVDFTKCHTKTSFSKFIRIIFLESVKRISLNIQAHRWMRHRLIGNKPFFISRTTSL